MQINEDINYSQYQIRAYQPGKITINDKTYTKSLIVTSEALITNWQPKTVNDITQTDINQILALKPDIILLGMGKHSAPPPKNLRQFECMSTAAACRTFIALSSEGRNVAAALLITQGNSDA